MQEGLKLILDIQELDMQMIQLMKLKTARQDELENIKSIKTELNHNLVIKDGQVIEIKKDIRIVEGEIAEIAEKLKKLESQQSQIKKVDEFNALSHEMSQLDRERNAKELKASDLFDKLAVEEDLRNKLAAELEATTENNRILDAEIRESIMKINEEGRAIKEKRDLLTKQAEPEMFAIYERLLKNKKDRVVVPIENRTCSGCHISITAQDENLVRKGERLVFCEHCSRIHYWPESEALEGTVAAPKARRRRKAAAT